MQVTTHYFDKAGPHNTEVTLQLALERAQTLGIQQVVVASSHGSTATKARALLGPAGIQVIAVTLCHSFEDRGWCMDEDAKAALKAQGIQIVTGLHALGDDVNSAFSDKYGGRTSAEIVRDTLYRFSQGMKVAVEGVLMAADGGLLEMENEVISVAGTGEGADTAIVCKPAYPRTFLDLEIREILAKPRVP